MGATNHILEALYHSQIKNPSLTWRANALDTHRLQVYVNHQYVMFLTQYYDLYLLPGSGEHSCNQLFPKVNID